MSEQQPEPQGQGSEPESIDIPHGGDAAFGQLMDFLGGDESGEKAQEPGAPAGSPAAGDGQAAPAGEGGDAASGAPAEPAAGAGGQQGVEKPAAGAGDGADAAAGSDAAAGADAGGAGDLPPEWTADASVVAPRFGDLSTALEERVAKGYHEEALESVKTEHAQYFEALNQHPRMLIGKEVPKAGGEAGEMETLRDAADAKDWQDAIKGLLVEEVRARSTAAMEENGDYLTTLHASIEVFQQNTDLIPFTKNFDKELAQRFTEIAKPYELRVDEKLHGWSIPVQPIINQLRSDIAAARAKRPATNADQARDDKQRFTKDDQPQGGIQSKAGNSADDASDFSSFFGTLGGGMEDFRI